MFVGVMSGTSMDGVDIVIASFPIKIIAKSYFPYPKQIFQKLNNLNPGFIEVARLDIELGRFFAKTILKTLEDHKIHAKDINAIGLHGQTIYHEPNSKTPFSLQIGNPNHVAFLTNITTVSDFRNKDIAAGGQGAPLVPTFHQKLFGNNDYAVINIGGIANISYLPKNKPVIGFDTGPGNCLLDSWCQEHKQNKFDQNGDWAKSGKVQANFLQKLLEDDYFQKPFPKSTGREYFNLVWLRSFLPKKYNPEDIQASLSELTATTITQEINRFKPKLVFVCGGGANNENLILRLQKLISPIKISANYNSKTLTPETIEALAFAWLAKQTLAKKPGNLKSVTGASKDLILGAIYYP